MNARRNRGTERSDGGCGSSQTPAEMRMSMLPERSSAMERDDGTDTFEGDSSAMRIEWAV